MFQFDTEKNILPFKDFLGHLKRQGFTIGVDHYLRLQALLNMLGKDSQLSELKYLICPVFAVNEKQQRQFYNAFDLYFKPIEPSTVKESEKQDVSIEISPGKLIRAKKWPYVLLGAIVIATSVYWYVKTLEVAQQVVPKPIPQGQPIQPGGTTDSTVHQLQPAPEFEPTFYQRYWEIIRWSVMLAAIIIFLLSEWYRFNRRKLILQRQRGKKPPYSWPLQIDPPESGLAKSGQFYLSACVMRRRLQSEVYQLDIGQTIHRAIESGGFPEAFYYKPLTKPPEYLILIDLPAFRDHYARFSDHIAAALENEDVHVVRYFYENNPRICFQEHYQDRVYLYDLQAKYYDHRLIVFGNGEELFDPVSSEVEKWAELFHAWQERAILTPERPKDWSMREVALAKKFIVLPVSFESLAAVIEHFENRSSPDLRALNKADSQLGTGSDKFDDLAVLQVCLGKDAFQWLCACALYPELHWNLTLYIGTLPCMPDNLVSEENLLRLMRLPCFREGVIPDEFRWELINALDKKKLKAICVAIVELLEKSPPSKESFAYDKYCLNLAVQKWMLFGKTHKEKWVLFKELDAVDRMQVVQDYTFLRLLESVPKPKLSIVLPQWLRKICYKKSVPVFGLKPTIRIVLTAITLLTTFFFWPKEQNHLMFFIILWGILFGFIFCPDSAKKVMLNLILQNLTRYFQKILNLLKSIFHYLFTTTKESYSIFYSFILCIFYFIFGFLFFSLLINSINLVTPPFTKLKVMLNFLIASFLIGTGGITIVWGFFIQSKYIAKREDRKRYLLRILPRLCFALSLLSCLYYSVYPKSVIIGDITANLYSIDDCIGYIETIPRLRLPVPKEYEHIYYAYSPILKMGSLDRYNKIRKKIGSSLVLEKGDQEIKNYEKQYKNYMDFLEKNFQEVRIPEEINICYSNYEDRKTAEYDHISVIKMSYMIASILGFKYDWRNRLKKYNICREQGNWRAKLNKFPLYTPGIKKLYLYYDDNVGKTETVLDKSVTEKKINIKLSQNNCDGWLYIFNLFHTNKGFQFVEEREFNTSKSSKSFKEPFDPVDQTMVMVFSPVLYENFNKKKAGDYLSEQEIKQFENFLLNIKSDCHPSIGYHVTLFQ